MIKPYSFPFLCGVTVLVSAVASVVQAQDYYLHEFEKTQLSDRFYGEGATFGDIDRDGTMDVVSGPYWYSGPDFEEHESYYEAEPFDVNGYSDHFLVFVHDFDGDDWPDILVIGFPGEPAYWYENPTDPAGKGHWERHLALEGVDNESPGFGDITGDGNPELICQQNGHFGYATVDWDNPDAPWTFHPISEGGAGGRFTHGLGIGDVDGDGRMDLLEKNGWWEQPDSLEGDPLWTHHSFQFASAGGAQMYAYDVDGDGLNDVITSLDAHGYGLAWYEQTKRDDGAIDFERHVIMDDDPDSNRFGVAFSQLHALDLVDVNGDGLKDIVTGKRWWAHNGNDPGAEDPAVLYWFRLDREGEGDAEFVPRPVDSDSGVGTQVTARDIDGDGMAEIVVGNKKGTFVFRNQRREVSQFEYFWAHQPGMFTVGLSPQQSADAMSVPEGFNVDLVAAEPDVRQPIALTVDAKGRVWVAEHYEYPDWSPEGEDRILFFEDTTGDGEYDRREVFYEGLNFASGLEVGHGGVWVGSPPDLLFIPDRDADGRPDGEPEVRLTGWGHQDTHETLNGFIWGPDGWLYGCHGVFTHSRVGKPGTPEEERQPINAGYWRYHPVKDEFEVFAWGTSNPWGIDFNDYGQAFSPVCVIPHLFHVVQGSRMHRQAGEHFDDHVYDDIETIADHRHYAGSDIREVRMDTEDAGGGHAHCGGMIYLGDNWPDEYRNTLFMSNIRGNRINNDTFEREGSGFVGRHNPDFLQANDKWFRGINLKYGPDGGVYLIDWYDQQACHQQRPDDRSNGRLFKITYGDIDPVQVDLHERSDAELVELQLEKNDWYVRTARRILHDRAARGELDPGVHADLEEILRNHSDPTRRLRALWALHVTDGLTLDLALRTLEADNEYVRAWTIQLLAEDREVPAEALEAMAEMSRQDPSPVVRLYLASALQRLPKADRWAIAEGLAGHEEDADDHNIPLMIWYGIEPVVPLDVDRAMQLAKGAEIPLIRQYVFRRAASDISRLEPVIEELDRAQTIEEQKEILEAMTRAFEERRNVPMPSGWSELYAKLQESPDPEVRDEAAWLTVRFGDERLFPAMREILADGDAPIDRRRRALEILVSGDDAEAAPILQKLLGEPVFRNEALKGLARFDHPDTPQAILARYDGFSEESRRHAVQTLASRPSYAIALLDGIEGGTVPRGDLSAFTIRQLMKMADRAVERRVSEVWGQVRAPSDSKQEEIDSYQARLQNVEEEADLSKGRALFDQRCGNCHTLFGEGSEIGPDLTGSNRANLEYILLNIVDPNAVVGRDYQLTTLEMADGGLVSGMIENENESSLTIRTLNDRVVVDRSEVTNRETAETSMMPEGLLLGLSDNELQDLIGYLASPRQVPLPGQEPIEGEELTPTVVSAGEVRPQDMGGFSAGDWSGDTQLWWTGAEPGDRLTLALPISEAGSYRVSAVFTKARDYGIVRVDLNGEALHGPIDLFQPPSDGRSDVVTTGLLSLGEIYLKEGRHDLTFEMVGANEDAIQRYMFGLDYVLLEPVAAESHASIE